MSPAGVPLAAGSISLRLYPHALAPVQIVDELCRQAALADAAGFDGVMTSEHHGGFPGYLPSPLQAAAFLLERMSRAWAAGISEWIATSDGIERRSGTRPP